MSSISNDFRADFVNKKCPSSNCESLRFGMNLSPEQDGVLCPGVNLAFPESKL